MSIDEQPATGATVVVPEHAVGPPGMGHGGWVAGLLAEQVLGPTPTTASGAVQVTLRRPTPLGTDLDLSPADAGWALIGPDGPIAEAVPTTLDLDVPPAPTPDAARAAEAGSPSRWDERGVHPICFGCGLARDDELGLEVAVGPIHVGDHAQVAARWRPSAARAGADGTVAPRWVLAALDCPGAMAWIVDEVRAGLLGRIVYRQDHPVPLGQDLVVTGWRLEAEGRKMFAGTALVDAAGTVLARARATWFGWG